MTERAVLLTTRQIFATQILAGAKLVQCCTRLAGVIGLQYNPHMRTRRLEARYAQ